MYVCKKMHNIRNEFGLRCGKVYYMPGAEQLRSAGVNE